MKEIIEAICSFDHAVLLFIQENLRFTRLSQDADVLQLDAADAAFRLNGTAVFDVVFLDPPYGKELIC